MKLTDIFKLNAHSKLILSFGACAFISGFVGDKLPKWVEELDYSLHPQVQNLILLAPFAIPTGLFKLVQIDAEKRVKEESEKTLSGFIGERIQKPIEKIVEKIHVSKDIPQYEKDYLIDEIKEADKTIGDINSWLEASREITFWLEEEPSHRQLLLDSALEATQIDKSYLGDFTNDMHECIYWLYHSIRRKKPYALNPPERFASAMLKGMPNNLDVYGQALEAVIERLESKMPTQNEKGFAWVTRDAVEHLLEKLREISELESRNQRQQPRTLTKKKLAVRDKSKPM